MGRIRKGENILALVPRRNCRWENGEVVTVFVPKARSKAGRRLIGLLTRGTEYSVHLDRVGSAIWKMCDGRRQISEICKELKIIFGDEVEPVHQRVASFFMSMERGGMITYNTPEPNTGGGGSR